MITLLVFCITAFSFCYMIIQTVRKKAALYLQLFAASAGCYALGKLFELVCILCAGSLPSGFHLGYLGSFGCFLFLTSANYGVMDGIMDDGSPIFRKYRLLAFLAPLVNAIFLISAIFSAESMEIRIVTIAIAIPVEFCAYYSLKQVLCPDMDFLFLKLVKPCNILALVLALLTSVQLLLQTKTSDQVNNLLEIFLAIIFLLLCVAVEKSRRDWKI